MVVIPARVPKKAEAAAAAGKHILSEKPLEVTTKRIDRILKAMPGIPVSMHFFVFEPRALATHAALLVITALLASAYPMWLVARLPIAATLRDEVVG